VTTKKTLTGFCDGQGQGEFSNNLRGQNTATATKSQIRFLSRRFGLAPLRAALVASLVFGEMRQ
jgi:hypothetical protein